MFSDGVFAVLITVLVLNLRPPALPTYNALVNATYIGLIRELVASADKASPTVRRIMHFRSLTTLLVFGVAALVALKYPLVGLGMCICCLIVYLKPDPPGKPMER
jgi:TMEM175 potassium channel family protein